MAYNEDNTETIPNRQNMYAITNGVLNGEMLKQDIIYGLQIK